jgi:hypothetical protein
MEQRRQLGEAVALPLRRDRGKLVADFLGQRHSAES